jgi:membrane protease YdiL (CAAX protease family)
MPTLLDLLYVALFAVVLPLWDNLVFWPAFHRRSHADRARVRLWAGSIGYAWALVGAGAVLWAANGRTWAALGLGAPEGWRLWASIALVVVLAVYHVYAVATVARSAEARASVRRQSGTLATLMPRTRGEMCWFGGVSLTASFCEEFLFRGYFIWALAPWLGWWGAAACSLLVFAIGHVGVYQSWSGAVRTGIVGAVYTVVVGLFNSLWPAIALHALVDVGAGLMVWLALRDGSGGGREDEGSGV